MAPLAHRVLVLGLSLVATLPSSAFAQSPGEVSGATRFHAGAEAAAVSLPSGTPGGEQDGYFVLTPLAGLESDNWSLELGARLRMRVFDAAPAQREGDLPLSIRHADWDEASDFGQLLRSVRFGNEGDAFFFDISPKQYYRLGRGQLVHRFRSRAHEDTHASSLAMGFQVGHLHSELFVSDVLAARVFAGEIALELGGLLTPGLSRRLYLNLQAAHDFGRGLLRTPGVTLLHSDLTAIVWRDKGFWVSLFGGGGFRPASDPSWGAMAGVSLEGQWRDARGGAKVELRHVGNGFRYAFMGAGYELARFTDVGFSGASIANVQLPEGESIAAELTLQLGREVGNPDGRGGLWLSASMERFLFGRTDADVGAALHFLNGGAVANARLTMMGVGERARIGLEADTRVRVAPSVYVLAFVGTSFFPQPDASLVRGVTAGIGMGVDVAR